MSNGGDDEADDVPFDRTAVTLNENSVLYAGRRRTMCTLKSYNDHYGDDDLVDWAADYGVRALGGLWTGSELQLRDDGSFRIRLTGYGPLRVYTPGCNGEADLCFAD